MKKYFFLPIFLSVICGITVNSALSALELEFEISPAAVTLQYNENLTLITSEILHVRYRGLPAAYFITFSEGSSKDPDNRKMYYKKKNWINYNLYGSSGLGIPLSDLSHTADESRFISSYAGNSTSTWSSASHVYYIVLPHNQLPERYTYSDSVVVNLYEGNSSRYTLRDSVSLDFSSTVEQTLSCHFVPSGFADVSSSLGLVLKYHDMTEGDVNGCDVVVKSNDKFRLTLGSANKGSLKHDESSSSVPYILRFDGSVKNFKGGSVQVLNQAKPTVVAGDRHTLSVEIGVMPVGLPEGAYRDIITMTMTSF